MKPLILLTASEAATRLERVAAAMKADGLDAIVVSDSANLFYLTGRVFCGWAIVRSDATMTCAVRRPEGLEGCVYVRKPEEIIQRTGFDASGAVGLETETSSYASIERLKAALGVAAPLNASAVMRRVRAVKTPAQLQLIRESGERHMRVYSRIPRIFREGMTDLELQIELERVSRLEGCLGQFRISGDTMEIYMGNVLAGENADTPTPYDFAMGGAGINPSLPVGADGTTVREGNSIMVDMNGNFTGYMTDMTRVYSLGALPQAALDAHRCSIEICHEFQRLARPGASARELYEMAAGKAEEAGLGKYFMGHRQKAGFVGHGVGIEINELPVIAPRSRDVIAEGNVIALEPKFVIPGVGAVGIENTYIVGADRTECATPMAEEIIDLA